MGILSRFGDIMASNINALLDRAEDPAKMIDQYLINLKKDLAVVKRETATIMVLEDDAKRAVDGILKDIRDDQERITKAVRASNDDDAKVLIARKQKNESDLTNATVTLTAAKENSKKLRDMYNKIVNDINALESRKASLKAKVAVASAQEKVNKLTGKEYGSAADGISRMEERINNKLNHANAMAVLNELPTDEASEVAAKYDSSACASVEEELAALKQQILE